MNCATNQNIVYNARMNDNIVISFYFHDILIHIYMRSNTFIKFADIAT